MYKQAEQSKRNKNKALDDSVTQKKHNGKQGFEFMDNRQEAIYQARMKEIGNRVLPGANTQMKSKEHSNGCCCSSCSNSHKALQAKKIMSSGTIQRFTTVSIEDNLGNRVDGKSGNESSTRSAFAGWPELRSSFERNVHPVDMPVLDEEGNATKETYSRNGYMCAEPNALSSLLHKYNVVKHPLDNK